MTNEERIIEIAKATADMAFPTALDASHLALIKGLTKREYFAVQAMVVILAGQPRINPTIVADMAVGLAETLLERLKYKTLDEWTEAIRDGDGAEFHRAPLTRDIVSGP